MRYRVDGAERETAKDVTMIIDAADQNEAERIASPSILVADVKPDAPQSIELAAQSATSEEMAPSQKKLMKELSDVVCPKCSYHGIPDAESKYDGAVYGFLGMISGDWRLLGLAALESKSVYLRCHNCGKRIGEYDPYFGVDVWKHPEMGSTVIGALLIGGLLFVLLVIFLMGPHH